VNIAHDGTSTLCLAIVAYRWALNGATKYMQSIYRQSDIGPVVVNYLYRSSVISLIQTRDVLLCSTLTYTYKDQYEKQSIDIHCS
jgi:hypothetical protein